MKTRRGGSLVELITASMISLLTLAGVVGLVQFAGTSWRGAEAELASTDTLSIAVSRLTPDIRLALRVDTSQTTTSKLTLVLPAVDADGEILLPLQDGSAVSYYTSNLTGSSAVQGSVLWRAVNGLPDTAWSLRSGHPVTDLGGSGLTFTLSSAADPDRVRIGLTSTQSTGIKTVARSTAMNVLLRNHQVVEQQGS